jgi:hypothetical protein
MRRWLAVGIVAFTMVVMMSDSMNALQNSADDAKWIAQLKGASLSQIEQGLPDKAFATWFGDHTKDAEVNYQIEACDVSANIESLKKGSFSCVTVSATRGIGSEVVMRFLVTGDESSKYACKFVIGQEGPAPGSPMKRMTRAFHSLSEMIKALGWQ